MGGLNYSFLEVVAMYYGTWVPLSTSFGPPPTLQRLVLTHTCVYLQNDSSKKAGNCQWRRKILAWISSNHEQDSYCCYRNSVAFRSHFKFWYKQYVRQQRDLIAFFITRDQTHFAGWILTVELFELKDVECHTYTQWWQHAKCTATCTLRWPKNSQVQAELGNTVTL